MFILYVILTLSWECLCYKHKLNRLYQYNNTQAFHFNCNKTENTFIYARSRNSLEISFQNNTRRFDATYSEHLIDYISCQTVIQVKSNYTYSFIQGELYFEELLNYDEEITYDLYTGILFFHFTVTEQLLATITISSNILLNTSYHLELYQSKVGLKYIQQFQNYENFHYIVSDRGQYSFAIAGPENLQFVINLQTQIVSKNFIYTNCSRNINLFDHEQNAWHIYSQYILIKHLIGIVQISYNDDPQIIELSPNDNLILMKNFNIIAIQSPIVLLYKFTDMQFAYCQSKIRMFLHKSILEQYRLNVYNYIKVESKSPRIKDQRIVQLEQYYSLTIDFYESPDLKSEIIYLDVSFKEYEIALYQFYTIQLDKGNNLTLYGYHYDIQAIYGVFELENISEQKKMIKAQTFITIFIKLQSKHYCKLINLYQVYKFRQSDNQLCFIYPYIKYIKIYLYPPAVGFNIANNQQIQKSYHLLDISSQYQYYYLIVTNQIQNIVVNQDHIRNLQPILLFNPKQLQILKIHNLQLLESEYIPNKDELEVLKIQQNLIFLVKYNIIQSIQLFTDILTKIKDTQPYILVVDVHIIRIEIYPIQSQFVLLLNVQTFDSSVFEQLNQKIIEYPNTVESSDYAFLNETLIIVDLEPFDCLGINKVKLAYDCLLKTSVQHSQEILQLKFRKCNSDLDLNQIYFEFHFEIFFCFPINQYTVITLQGILSQAEDYFMITCLQPPCVIIVISNEQNLTLVEDQLIKTSYLIAVNTLVTDIKQQGKYLLIVRQQQQFTIHSNNDVSIKNIMEQNAELSIKQQKLELTKGIYLFEFFQIESTPYLTIFADPTILYENILFKIEEEEVFTIQDTKHQFIVIEFKDIQKFQYIKYENNYITHLSQNIISLKLSNTDQLLTLSGEFNFIVHYTNHPCYFIDAPLIQLLNKSTQLHFLIHPAINEQCQVQHLRIKYNNIDKDCLQLNYYQCDLQLDYVKNQVNTDYSLLSKEILIFSQIR